MYNEASLIEPNTWSNRLSSTTIGQTTETYAHDTHGNMTQMPHLPRIDWDCKNQMRCADKGSGGAMYFTYDSSCERVRKVWEHAGTIEERIYLGGFEIYRARKGGALTLERQTLHIMDGVNRISMVETKTSDTNIPALTPISITRFQLGNHLGSVAVEIDEKGQLISYEEYHPYGTSAYRAANSAIEVSQKRYRYTGKERDEETSLEYHGARYYIPWLGRWSAADCGGLKDGPNVYRYVNGNPVRLHDPNGAEGKEVTQPEQEQPKPKASVLDNVGFILQLEFHKEIKFVSGMARNAAGIGTGLLKRADALAHFDPVQIGKKMKEEVDTYGGVTGVRRAANVVSPLYQGAKDMQDAAKAQIAGKPEDSGEHLAGAGLALAAAARPGPGPAAPAAVTTGGALVAVPARAGVASAAVRSFGAAALSTGGKVADDKRQQVLKEAAKEEAAKVEDIQGNPRGAFTKLRERYNREKALAEAKGRFAEFRKADLHPGGTGDVNIGVLRGSPAADELAANRLAGFENTPKGYVWHHHQDLGRMQLVSKAAHNRALAGGGEAGHFGGVHIWEQMTGIPYR